jgi:4-amino-4-deoxy-L-arabinose transferase-like glycosyltransferase
MDGSRAVRAAGLLTALAFCLLALWSFVVPVFESPDEEAHWQYARHLREARALPVYGPEFVEGNSPPLYYALVAPFADATDEPTPLWWVGATGQVENAAPPRFYLNASDDFTRYWALRRARIASAALASLTVFFTFLAGREATGSPATGLLAAALVAFLPQFSFRGMSVSNDALVTPLAAASLYWILKIARRGFTWRDGLFAVLAMTGALLSKVSAIFVPAVFGFAVLREPGPWPARVRRLAVLAVGLLLAAPWLIRNQHLYGDPLAVGAMLGAVSPIVHVKPITSPYFYTVLPMGLACSFVGLFGWMNLPIPSWAYAGYWSLGGLAIAGWARRPPADRRARTALGVLIAFAVLALAVVVRINLSFDQPQGRYLFPALAAFAVLAAAGLERLPRWSPGASAVLAAALLVANLAIVSLVVAPAYWPAPVSHLSTARSIVADWQPSDMEAIGDDAFRITGADPHLTAPIRAQSSQYNFLSFEIQSPGDGNLIGGRASFGMNGSDPDGAHSMSFVWKADGAAHRVRVPLFVHPGWGSGATAIRIDPVDRTGGRVGGTFVLRSPELSGTL